MAVCFDLTGLNFEHSWLSGQWIDEWTRNDSCGTQFKSDRSLIAARPPGFHQQETTDVEQLWWRETRCKPRCRFIQWLQKASSRPVRLIVMSLPLRHLTSLLAYAEGCREVFYCSTLLRLVGKPPLTTYEHLLFLCFSFDGGGSWGWGSVASMSDMNMAAASFLRWHWWN